MADSHGDAHHGPSIKQYLVVFGALCIFTAVSFVVNEWQRSGDITAMTSLAIILGVAICKAVLVGAFFMHLKWEWAKLYFVIVPVSILGVMMMLVLLPDAVLVWHHDDEHKEPAPAAAKDHHH